MIIDIAVVLVLIVALIIGYQRGVIQPLMAEIFFFGTLLVVFRFHDQYTTEMQKLLHLNAVLSVAAALILAVVLGAIGGAIGGAFHRLESIRGMDGLLGVFVHGVVTLVVIYLAMSALVTLDNAFGPALKTASLTVDQVDQLENVILSNPITSAMVSKSDIRPCRRRPPSQTRRAWTPWGASTSCSRSTRASCSRSCTPRAPCPSSSASASTCHSSATSGRRT